MRGHFIKITLNFNAILWLCLLTVPKSSTRSSEVLKYASCLLVCVRVFLLCAFFRNEWICICFLFSFPSHPLLPELRASRQRARSVSSWFYASVAGLSIQIVSVSVSQKGSSVLVLEIGAVAWGYGGLWSQQSDTRTHSSEFPGHWHWVTAKISLTIHYSWVFHTALLCAHPP